MLFFLLWFLSGGTWLSGSLGWAGGRPLPAEWHFLYRGRRCLVRPPVKTHSSWLLFSRAPRPSREPGFCAVRERELVFGSASQYTRWASLTSCAIVMVTELESSPLSQAESVERSEQGY